jgi:hypothetical protein
MTEAESTSEKSVNSFQSTRRYNTKDSHLRTHRFEYHKSYVLFCSATTEDKILLHMLLIIAYLTLKIEQFICFSGYTQVKTDMLHFTISCLPFKAV